MRKLYLIVLLVIASFVSNAQVISQIYAGGGNSGATYTYDFIEIFNNTQSSINLSGYSVQYATATGTTWQVTALSNFILQPGQYYLIQEDPGANVGTSILPMPDATGGINLSATAGKVALVNSLTALTGSCPAVGTYIDLVGYGSTASCFEGTGPAPTTSNTTLSIIRGSNGCTDNNNNNTNFSIGTVNPRNTSSTRTNCPSGAPLPVKFTNLKASKKASAIELSFTNATETDVANYSIERSANGIQYTSIATLKATRNDGGQNDYTFIDEQPAKGVNFYRIKATEVNGKTAYSIVVKMNAAATQSGLTIYPNPVKGGQLNFQITNLVAGAYELLIRNATGQVVYKQNIRNVENSFSQTIPVTNLKSGMYYLELSGASKMSKQFIIE